MEHNLKGLYVLTDDTLTPQDTLIAQAKALLDAGVRVLQLRDKTRTDAILLPHAKALQALCELYGATFIVNDRLGLAKASNAHGLHIGIEDGTLVQARALLPDAIIGVSCYGDIERAKEAEAQGADYVAFGSFFSSPTKPHSAQVPLEVLAQAKAQLSIPICAIGGVTRENIHLLKDADMVSVVSAAYTPDAIAENIAALQKAMA